MTFGLKIERQTSTHAETGLIWLSFGVDCWYKC